MKKFVSVLIVAVFVTMCSVSSFSDTRVAKVGSFVTFQAAGRIEASIALKRISDNTTADSIEWNANAILQDKNKWHTATVYAQVQAIYTTGSSSPVLMMVQDNAEKDGDNTDYQVTTARSDTWYGTNYNLYNGLVKKDSKGGANNFVPMAWFIKNSLGAPEFSNPETDSNTRYLVDDRDSFMPRDSHGDIDVNAITKAMWNYVTIRDQNGFVYIANDGSNPLQWNDTKADQQYRNLTGVTNDTAYIYFGGQFANAEADTSFGTRRILFQIVNE